MKGQGTEIWKKEEYSYEGAHGFIPVMVSYMHEDDKIHPAMIVVPGGGYRQVSRTEAHLVAMDFYEADYNVFVLVCVDGYPLGWAKNNRGVLKNKYLSGWRMMS